MFVRTFSQYARLVSADRRKGIRQKTTYQSQFFDNDSKDKVRESLTQEVALYRSYPVLCLQRDS